jgi:hypothetical protein
VNGRDEVFWGVQLPRRRPIPARWAASMIRKLQQEGRVPSGATWTPRKGGDGITVTHPRRPKLAIWVGADGAVRTVH